MVQGNKENIFDLGQQISLKHVVYNINILEKQIIHFYIHLHRVISPGPHWENECEMVLQVSPFTINSVVYSGAL
jgi:hypothetical protein